MKKLMLSALLFAGCIGGNSQTIDETPTTCYKLEMCEGHFSHVGRINIFCVYGYDANGNKNGEVQRFIGRDAIAAWSEFHPEAKACE